MLNLLCVDDSPDILSIMAVTLRAEGFTVTTCTNPFEGLTKLGLGAFDAIVTDFDMPELNGTSFAELARAAGYTNPIILCTGSSDLERVSTDSIDAVVSKASGTAVLGDTVHNCIQRRIRITRPP